MKQGAFNVILDGQFGSCGKGKFAAWLASEHRLSLSAVVGNNGPNAGHTTVFNEENDPEPEDKRVVLKQLPSGAIFNKNVFIGAGAVIDENRLRLECEELGVVPKVHPRAPILEPSHVETEIGGLQEIASTASGTGAAIASKVLRKNPLYARFQSSSVPVSSIRYDHKLKPWQWAQALRNETLNGMTLCEVSQGHWLSVDYGLDYPHCTSRNCTTQAALDQCGMPPAHLGDVYLLLRSYPIRVGNGNGWSGPFHDDSVEIQWHQIAAWDSMPIEERNALIKREHTTVTKRLRRVSTFSYSAAKEAAIHNGATKVLLNFAQYIDWDAHGVREWVDLPYNVRDWANAVEEALEIPVFAIGTGEHIDDVCVNPRA